MKVMCFKSPLGWFIAAHVVGSKAPVVGEYYTIKSQYPCKCGKHDVYDLEEFPLLGGFSARCFAILPSSTADEIDGAEHEAIVPNPMIVESDPLSIEEKALKAYYQVYEVTGDERRAADVYFQILQNPMP